LTYLLKTLTLVISFEWYVLGLWYFSWVFLLKRLFCGYHRFDIVTLTLMFNLLIENFNHAYIFWVVCTKTLIFHFTLVFVVIKPFIAYQQISPCDLDLYAWLTENFNLGFIFWMVSLVCIRTLIFQMSAPWNKTILWVPTDLMPRPWP
jgi:hypothetical protein